METFSALLAICAGNSPVPGEFPAQRPVTRSFGVFFDLRLNKQLRKQSWGWWFDTPSRPLWRHHNAGLILPLPFRISPLAPRVPFWYKDRLARSMIPIIKIRRSWDRLIYMTGFFIPMRQRLCIDHLEIPWLANNAWLYQADMWTNIPCRPCSIHLRTISLTIINIQSTVKPVCNDHL